MAEAGSLSVSTDMRSWAQREDLSDAIISVLEDQGFTSVEQIQSTLQPEDVKAYFQDSKLLNVAQCLALKRAVATLSGTSGNEVSGAVPTPPSPPALDHLAAGTVHLAGQASPTTVSSGASVSPDGVKQFTLLLLGRSGSAERTVGNMIFGQALFDTAATKTNDCERQISDSGNLNLEIIHSPLLHNTGKTQEEMSQQIVQTVVGVHPGAHAIPYVVGNDEYTSKDLDDFRNLKAHFDEDITRYVIVVLEKESMRHQRYIRLVLEECNNRYVIMDTSDPQPQTERVLSTVRGVMRENGSRPYSCPKYRQIGQGLEREVAARLHEVERRDLQRLKQVEQKLEDNERRQKRRMDEEIGQRHLLEESLLCGLQESIRRHQEELHRLDLQREDRERKDKESMRLMLKNELMRTNRDRLRTSETEMRESEKRKMLERAERDRKKAEEEAEESRRRQEGDPVRQDQRQHGDRRRPLQWSHSQTSEDNHRRQAVNFSSLPLTGPSNIRSMHRNPRESAAVDNYRSQAFNFSSPYHNPFTEHSNIQSTYRNLRETAAGDNYSSQAFNFLSPHHGPFTEHSSFQSPYRNSRETAAGNNYSSQAFNFLSPHHGPFTEHSSFRSTNQNSRETASDNNHSSHAFPFLSPHHDPFTGHSNIRSTHQTSTEPASTGHALSASHLMPSRNMRTETGMDDGMSSTVNPTPNRSVPADENDTRASATTSLHLFAGSHSPPRQSSWAPVNNLTANSSHANHVALLNENSYDNTLPKYPSAVGQCPPLSQAEDGTLLASFKTLSDAQPAIIAPYQTPTVMEMYRFQQELNEERQARFRAEEMSRRLAAHAVEMSRRLDAQAEENRRLSESVEMLSSELSHVQYSLSSLNILVRHGSSNASGHYHH